MITTILPTYKRPQLLKRALNSILVQTYQDFQVHICDNSSDDETEKIVQEFTNDSRIHYHKHKKNIGMIQNYNFGFQLIKTPYFSFLSDDDYLLPIFYETAIKNLRQFSDAACVACNVNIINESEDFLFSTLSGWTVSGYLKNPLALLELCNLPYKAIIPTCTLFNFNILKNTPPFFKKNLESLWDHEYFLRITSKHPIVIEKKICGVFYCHSNSYSTNFNSLYSKSCKEVSKYLSSFNFMINHLKPILPNPLKKLTTRNLKIYCAKFLFSYSIHYKKEKNYTSFLYSILLSLKLFITSPNVFIYYLPKLYRRLVKKLSKQAYENPSNHPK